MRLVLLLAATGALGACGTARPADRGDGDADSDADSDGDTDADGDGDGDADCGGVGTACYDGPEGTLGVGPCATGQIVCEAGQAVCRGWIGPSPELCNGQDDDCDGEADGESAGSGVLCNTRLQGDCQLGRIACEGGVETCVADHAPGVETCANDGVDDDCNGVLDDVPELAVPCDTGMPGLCGDGQQACDGAELVCLSVPELLGQTESCGTGEDEDCDGLIDEADCVSCLNPGGGALVADNGTGNAELYCYAANDTNEDRARKACESHFGEGSCCVIVGGYQGQQYGDCNLQGDQNSIHWHWDNHPAGHCEPNYIIGDVVSPGWCGVVLGNFLN